MKLGMCLESLRTRYLLRVQLNNVAFYQRRLMRILVTGRLGGK